MGMSINTGARIGTINLKRVSDDYGTVTKCMSSDMRINSAKIDFAAKIDFDQVEVGSTFFTKKVLKFLKSLSI